MGNRQGFADADWRHDLSDEMIERAVTANSRLLDELESIAAMKASFETAELTMRDKN